MSFSSARRRLCTGALACLACHPSASVEPGASPAGPPKGPGATKRADRPALDGATARAEARRILESVAKARNLAVSTDVKVEVIDKTSIREFSRKSLYEDTTVEEMRLLGRIESSLGVIPVGSDPERLLLDLLEDGVLGLYDPKRKTLFIGDFVSKPMLSMVVGHEIAHGLQDMHFDLEALQKPLRHESDRESAIRFLVEGDAQASYLAWVSGEEGLASIDEATLVALGDQALSMAGYGSKVPVLARALQMPYNDGAATVIRLVGANGWTAIDALFEDLPQTTEQMLHVDKLRAREPARAAKLEETAVAPALPGLSLVWHDTIGEAALLAMLAEVTEPHVARKAAAGWGGDHMLAFECRATTVPRRGAGRCEVLDAPFVAGVIAWDSQADAAEFETAFGTYLAERVGASTLVERRGDRVVFAAQIPVEVDREQLALALWRGAKVEPQATRKERPS